MMNVQDNSSYHHWNISSYQLVLENCSFQYCLFTDVNITLTSILTHFSLYQNSMVINSEDHVLIKVLCQEKGHGSKKLLAEFPNKAWSLTSLKRLLRKMDASGLTDRKRESRRKRTVQTAENVRVVEELSMSQETAPGSHRILQCIKLLESSVFRR